MIQRIGWYGKCGVPCPTKSPSLEVRIMIYYACIEEHWRIHEEYVAKR